MTEQEFIEKAIEGGWLFKGKKPGYSKIWDTLYVGHEGDDYEYISIEQVVLDMHAWAAVSGSMGWDKKTFQDIIYAEAGEEYFIDEYSNNRYEFEIRMHEMIEHIIQGNSIRSYLKTL